MLVGHAQGLDRGLAAVLGHSLAGHILAQGLGPQLAEPVGHILEGIGIGHGHLDVDAHILHADVLQHGLQQGGVVPHVVALAARVHGRGALQHGADVNAAHRRGQQAHRGQLGEAAAHASGDKEQVEAMLLGQLDEVALLAVGGGDDVVGPLVAHFLLEQLGNGEVLAHGLGGGAGLGNHVEAGGLDVNHVQQGLHALGVDVVLHIQAGAAALFGGKFVVVQVVEGLLHGDGAQGAAADAQHHEGVELLADALGGLFDMGDDFLLIIGQLGPAQPAGATGGLHGLIGRGGKGRIFLHLAAGNSILEAQGIGHHVIHVQFNRLFAHICHWYSSFPATVVIR